MNGRENNTENAAGSLEPRHIDKIVRTIAAALMVGKALMAFNGNPETLTAQDALRWHKEDCERAVRFLTNYQVTDYVKFAKLIEKCDLVTIFAEASDDPELSKLLLTNFVTRDSPGCIRYIGQEDC